MHENRVSECIGLLNWHLSWTWLHVNRPLSLFRALHRHLQTHMHRSHLLRENIVILLYFSFLHGFEALSYPRCFRLATDFAVMIWWICEWFCRFNFHKTTHFIYHLCIIDHALYMCYSPAKVISVAWYNKEHVVRGTLPKPEAHSGLLGLWCDGIYWELGYLSSYHQVLFVGFNVRTADVMDNFNANTRVIWLMLVLAIIRIACCGTYCR